MSTTEPSAVPPREDVLSRTKQAEKELADKLRKVRAVKKQLTGKATPEELYEAHKARASERQARIVNAYRDIGKIPPVSDPARRAAAEESFRVFCESYFPHTFRLRFSPDHLRAIGKIETSVRTGGLFAFAMPRGSGKTTLSEIATIWAILHGFRRFVMLIGSDEKHAVNMLDSIKTELETNELLVEDYPESCYPIARLEGISHRCNGQLCEGERTHIGWNAAELVLPTIRDSIASGAIIRVAGITGRIRGAKYKTASGSSVRPDLVILDDPQTDESAKSVYQCETRLGVINSAVLNLAGPGKKISGIMPCTVIRQGDLADQVLNRERNPRWNGERTKLVYSFPINVALWNQYETILKKSLSIHGDIRDATAFYRANQAALDEGASVAWPERFNDDEASAVQHALNLKIFNEASFAAEYQNEPLEVREGLADDLTADFICGKVHGIGRGVLPLPVSHLTAFVDVQQDLLYYLVAGWSDDFAGYVVDYGTYPEQRKRFFRLADASPTLKQAAQTTSLEGWIYAGLDRLTSDLLGRQWLREDGTEFKISRCLIDANWGLSTEVVYQFCRQSQHAAVLTPSHGRYIGASSQPFSEYTRKPGERIGDQWRIPVVTKKRTVRHVLYDTNYWKSFIHSRLNAAIGDPGCLTLYGHKPDEHRLLAEHILAEFRVRTEGRGRTVDEWKQRPEKPDNHWFDCLVGSAVGASMSGCALAGVVRPVKVDTRSRGRISFAELQRRKAGG